MSGLVAEGAAMDWGMIRSFGDLARSRAADLRDKPAFVGNGRSISFAEVNSRMNRLNHALARVGLVAAERVAILSRNRPEYFEVYGVAKSGLVAVPLNWRLAPRELLHPLRDSSPVAIVAEAEFAPLLDELRPELEGIRHFILLGGDRDGWISYEALLAEAPSEEPADHAAPDDPVCLTYSSGTTGVPKGAILTHRGTLSNCRAVMEKLLQLTPNDVGLAVMPLFHVGGMWYHLFPSFASGGTTFIEPQFDPRAVLARIEERGITHVHLVPTMIGALIDEPDARHGNLGRLRTIYYAASSIPLPMLARAMGLFGHCGFVQSFGSTEAGSVTALTAADHVAAVSDPARAKVLGSCGLALPGVEVQVRDPSGRPAAGADRGHRGAQRRHHVRLLERCRGNRANARGRVAPYG